MEEKKLQTGHGQTESVQTENNSAKAVSVKRKKRWADLLLIFGILLVVGAGGALLWLEKNNEDSKNIYEGLKEAFVSTVPNQTMGDEPGSSSGEPESQSKDMGEETENTTEEDEVSTEEYTGENVGGSTEENTTAETTAEAPTDSQMNQGPWYQMIAVNFEGLRQVNPDVIGWIHFENEDISYPVLYAEEGEEYLRTDIYGNASTAGCLYVGNENSAGFDDRRVCVYGHNMKNLTMFGKLKYYIEKESYYQDHQYFQILEDGVIHRYRIFSFFPVNENEVPMVRVSYGEKDDVEFEFLIGQLKQRSQWGETDVEVGVDDHILTLVTCFTDNHRTLINAVRVDSYTLP